MKLQKYLNVLILAICMTVVNAKLAAQTDKYAVESFQGNYEELENYESIALNTEFDPLWTYEFQLDFQFPFFDSSYNRVIFDRSGYGAFTDDEDNSLFLFQYYSWTYDPFMGSTDIPSDVRFSHVNYKGTQAFVLQFTKVRIFADLYEDSLDTYLNFQFWLFENGNIEVHFGNIHMDNNPIYAAGKGLYCFTTDEGIDTSEICGPYMGIANPFDENDAIGVVGAYNSYTISGDIYSNFTFMPPEGWVIRFKPQTVSTHDPPSKLIDLLISPNPVSNSIRLPQSGGLVTITDSVGKRIYAEFIDNAELDVSSLAPGIYFLNLINENRQYLGKFVKN